MAMLNNQRVYIMYQWYSHVLLIISPMIQPHIPSSFIKLKHGNFQSSLNKRYIAGKIIYEWGIAHDFPLLCLMTPEEIYQLYNPKISGLSSNYHPKYHANIWILPILKQQLVWDPLGSFWLKARGGHRSRRSHFGGGPNGRSHGFWPDAFCRMVRYLEAFTIDG
jgi:hypothetical protein